MYSFFKCYYNIVIENKIHVYFQGSFAIRQKMFSIFKRQKETLIFIQSVSFNLCRINTVTYNAGNLN